MRNYHIFLGAIPNRFGCTNFRAVLLLAGIYTVTVSAAGFISKTSAPVTVVP